jgi:hypothetical protein
MIGNGRFVLGRRWRLGCRVRSVLQSAAVSGCVVLAGCSRNPPPELPDPASPEADVAFVIENRRSDDVVIELLRDGQRQRLGLVTAQSKATFTHRWGALVNATRVALSIHPIGTNQRYVTENLVLRPGSEVDLTVNQALRQSVVSVF